jgi:hypothetical protein
MLLIQYRAVSEQELASLASLPVLGSSLPEPELF